LEVAVVPVATADQAPKSPFQAADRCSTSYVPTPEPESVAE
jgi:hypothetical protein